GRLSDRESEKERLALQKELRAIALSEAKSFANTQARAGRTLEETLTTIRSSLASVLQINPVVGSLVKAIGDSEDVFSILDRNLLKITNAVRARFEVAAGKFESRFVKENKDR